MGMKYIKTFETLQKEPQIGDYVAIRLPHMVASQYVRDNNPGIFIAKIVDMKNNIYKVQYDNTFKHMWKNWWVQKFEFIDHAKNRRDLDYIFNIDKYNL
jgi:hypothetical protein